MSSGDLAAFLDEHPVLRSVRGVVENPRCYAEIEFEFDGGALNLGCDPDRDEVIVRLLASPSSHLSPLAADDAITDLLGASLEYFWTLINHRGYSDGAQVRFLSIESRKRACWQFEVAASTLIARRVEP